MNERKKKGFYRAFEEQHRGSRDVIKERLRVYLPFVRHCQELYEECAILDLGCGRGEWLELMTEEGFQVFGVDLDEGMLQACGERKLPVERKDALEALGEQEPESLIVVSGFHIAEHVPFEILLDMVEESLRVLKPGGLLILETPNPENLVVGTSDFYLDPTHQRPLPPKLLAFLPEYCGFARTKILCLQENQGLKERRQISMRELFYGVSPDYAVVAQKETQPNRMALFDNAFNAEYGVKLSDLAERFQGELAFRFDGVTKAAGKRVEEMRQLIRQVDEEAASDRKDRFKELKDRLARLEEKTGKERHAQQMLLESIRANQEYLHRVLEEERKENETLKNSRSWKMTAPYRAFGDFFRRLRHPGSQEEHDNEVQGDS